MARLWMIVLGALVLSAPRAFSLVDLHSHLFMKKGMGVIFRGKFDEPLKARSWKNMLRSKINAETMDKSGLNIVVAALYAHPILATGKQGVWHSAVKNSIENQVKEAREFVKKYPNWIIATNASQALKARREGKKVLILSVEGAHSIFKDEKDIDYFIDKLGIAIVTPMHLINTKYGGAAFMKGFRKTIFTTKYFSRRIKREGVKINPKGLTKKGHWLIDKLMEKRVWIDLSHAGDLAQEAIIPKMERARLPLLYTHIAPRPHHPAERGISDWALGMIKMMDGFVGIVPSEEMLKDTPEDKEMCPKECGKCKGGVWAMATQYNYLAKRIGAQNIALGIDFNGGIPHVPPSKCDSGFSYGDKKGLHRADQLKDLWGTMERVGARTLPNFKAVEERFLQLWARVRP